MKLKQDIKQIMQRYGNCLVAFLLLLFVTSRCSAQDPTFSQYNLNQVYYNPAYTGIHGGYGLTATYRSLWPNVPGKVFPGPLSTYYALFDTYIKAGSYTAGTGIFAMQDVEGEGYLTTSTIGISYAQHFPRIGGKTDALPRIQLSLGFKAYVNSIAVNWDKLVFSNDLNLDQGIIGQSLVPHNGVEQKYTVDMDAGLLLKNNFLGQNKWYNELGFAMAHILSPSSAVTGVMDEASEMPKKYVGSYRSLIRLNNNHFYLGPTILFEKQQDFYEVNTGLDLFVNPYANPFRSNGLIPLCFSVYNRLSLLPGTPNTNAIIGAVNYKFLVGKNKMVYTIGFSADFPYTGLALQTKEAYELSIVIVFPRKGINYFSKCPWDTY